MRQDGPTEAQLSLWTQLQQQRAHDHRYRNHNPGPAMTVSKNRSPQRHQKPATAEKSDHPHHWVIATPNGPESEAKCKVCGAVQLLPNGYVADRIIKKWGGAK